MNRTTILALAFSVLGAGIATAQPAIKVRQGDTFTYTTTTDTEMVTSLAGQEQSGGTNSVATTVLTVGKADRKKINWVMAMPELTLKITNTAMPQAAFDTTLSAPPQNYVTDASGKVISAPTTTEIAGIEMMMGGSMEKNFGLWFVPVLAKGSQSGASWEEVRRDTMAFNPAQEPSGGVPIIFTQNLRYIYDGITDTLGLRVARVRWTATSATYEGSGMIQGTPATMEGDGAVTGVSYFSTKDGLLFASETTSESNMRVGINAGGQQMVIPIVQTTRVSISRKK